MEAIKKQFRIIEPVEAREGFSRGAEMPSSVMEQPVVAPSGEFWDVGDVRLWRSTDPNVLLFVPTRLALERTGRGGRCQAAVTQFRRWQDGLWHYAGGSALLVVSSAVQPAPGTVGLFAERWRSALFEQGYTGNLNPVFLPLPRRRQRVRVSLDPETGISRHLGEGENYGNTTSLLIELTAKGAEAWGSAIREKAPAGGAVKWTYEYPQMLPDAETYFTIDGTRVSTERQFEAGDLSLKLTFKARVWVEAAIETNFSALLEPLDESYLNVVPVEAPLPLQVVVKNDRRNTGGLE
ncbi:MAG TPA: hypothetical protein VFD58_17915 [Blastocatellia bacterium]|nr:hypothetical protein [Blastocatellia bacterium]